MNNSQNLWAIGQTLSNGWCGYHSMAEAFTRVARLRPDLINAQLFNRDNELFRPVHDFLRHSLGLDILTPESLQQRLLAADAQPSDFIARHMAPAIMIAALNNYKLAILPARQEIALQMQHDPNHLRQLLREHNDSFYAQQQVAILQPFENTPENQAAILAYQRSIDTCILAERDLGVVNTFESLRGINLFNQFIRQQPIEMTPELAHQFMLSVNQGLNYEQFAEIGVLSNLGRLLFHPIAVEYHQENARIQSAYYPVIVVEEAGLSLPEHPRPAEVIAAVYRCASGAHFQYAVSRLRASQSLGDLSAPARRGGSSQPISNRSSNTQPPLNVLQKRLQHCHAIFRSKHHNPKQRQTLQDEIAALENQIRILSLGTASVQSEETAVVLSAPQTQNREISTDLSQFPSDFWEPVIKQTVPPQQGSTESRLTSNTSLMQELEKRLKNAKVMLQQQWNKVSARRVIQRQIDDLEHQIASLSTEQRQPVDGQELGSVSSQERQLIPADLADVPAEFWEPVLLSQASATPEVAISNSSDYNSRKNIDLKENFQYTIIVLPQANSSQSSRLRQKNKIERILR